MRVPEGVRHPIHGWRRSRGVPSIDKRYVSHTREGGVRIRGYKHHSPLGGFRRGQQVKASPSLACSNQFSVLEIDNDDNSEPIPTVKTVPEPSEPPERLFPGRNGKRLASLATSSYHPRMNPPH